MSFISKVFLFLALFTSVALGAVIGRGESPSTALTILGGCTGTLLIFGLNSLEMSVESKIKKALAEHEKECHPEPQDE